MPHPRLGGTVGLICVIFIVVDDSHRTIPIHRLVEIRRSYSVKIINAIKVDVHLRFDLDLIWENVQQSYVARLHHLFCDSHFSRYFLIVFSHSFGWVLC